MQNKEIIKDDVDLFIDTILFFEEAEELHSRLRIIFSEAANLIHKVEKKHCSAINTVWGKNLYKAANKYPLLLRAKLASDKIPSQIVNNNILNYSYFGALLEIRRIVRKININNQENCIYPIEHGREDYMNFIEENVTPERLKDAHFLNLVVPVFFTLQLHCYQLLIILNNPRRVPLDNQVRTKRASAAGKAKNYGKDILKSMVLDFIESINPEEKFKSISSFLTKHSYDIEKILKEYQNLREKPTEINNPKLNYNISADRIHALIYEWKDDPFFMDHLEKICNVKPIKQSPFLSLNV